GSRDTAAPTRVGVDALPAVQRLGEPLAVQPPVPGHVAEVVVLLGPLALEHRLRAPVAALLAPVRADAVAAVVPDDGRGAEAEGPAAGLQAPADVDVVTGGA